MFKKRTLIILFIASISAILQLHTTEQINTENQFRVFLYPITIKNKSNQIVYIATYYKRNIKNFECYRSCRIRGIKPLQQISIDKPMGKITYARKLIFAKNKDILKPNLTKTEYNLITKQDLENLSGSTLYIRIKDNVLKGCTNFESKITKPFWNLLSSLKNNFLNPITKKIESPYKNKQAHVKKMNGLSKQEKYFLTKRKEYSLKTNKKLFNTDTTKSEIPNVAICCSGGGYRAMIGTLGALLGLEKIGILDCVNYISTLSGSTWFVAPWMASEITLNEYKETLKNKVQKPLIIKNLDLQKTIKTLVKKIAFKQKISLVDIFGELLTNTFLDEFKNQKHKLYLSESSKKLESGKIPLPIYTAVETTTDNYNWFEFTPYEIGSISLNYYVKPWAFGRKFVDGESKSFSPEQTLGFLMGIFGSAFAANYEEIINSINDNQTRGFYDLVYLLTSQPDWKKIRISPAKIRNFMYGIDESILNNKKYLKLVDAGVAINLPFPPLLKPERKIDLIIVCDFSTNAQSGTELKKAEKYAIENNLKFPEIDLKKLKNNIVTVFKDKKDPTVPVVIYCPLIKNHDYSKSFHPSESDFCSTFNFSYTNEEFDKLCGLTKFNITQNKTKIIEEIFKIMQNKTKYKEKKC